MVPPAPASAPAPANATAPAAPRSHISWRDPERLKPLAPWVTTAYLLGALLMVARLLVALRGGQRLRKLAEPVKEPQILSALHRQARRLGLRREPAVAWCRRVGAPAVVGVLRPVVLLPVALSSGMTAAQIESILAHELAHVRRLDPLANAAQGLIEALLFFHPAVWHVSRRLRLERENCCDDLVVSDGSEPLEYVKSLVRAAELGLLAQAPRPAGAAALAAVSRPSQLRLRIVRLLQGEPAAQLRVSPAPVLLALLLATALGVGAWYRVAYADEGKAGDASRPATHFIGRLIDTEGRPISNAYIYPEDASLSRDSVRSDRDGVFELKDVKPDQKHWLVWSQRRSQRSAFTVPATAPSQPVSIRVETGDAAVEGRVVDAAGNGVPDASVWAHVTLADGVTYHFKAYSKTDAEGYYSVGDVPAAAGVTLRVGLSQEPGGAESVGPIAMEPPDKRVTYELPDLVTRRTVPPPSKPPVPRVRYYGRVLDEAGKPIAGARVEMSYPKNHMVSTAGVVITDAQGRFTKLIPSDAERVDFRLNHPEYIGFHFDDGHRPPSPPVQALKDGSAVLVMKRGLPISGVVKDAAGKPVENALVLAGRLYSTTPGPECEVIEDSTTFRTTGDGRFRIGGLPAGWRDVTVVSDVFAPVRTSIEVKPDAPPEQVTLKPGVSYAARVVDPDGKPVAGATVGVDEWVVGGQQGRGLSRFTKTDTDGRFELAHLPDRGTLNMYVGKAPYLNMDFQWTAQGAAAPVLTLCPHPVIRGRVVEAATGEPLKEFEVQPWWGVNQPHALDFNDRAKGRPDGSFELTIDRVQISDKGSPPFYARVVARGYVPELSPPVYAGKPYEPFVIKLQKGEPVTGVVADADGKPLAGAQVTLVEPGRVTFIEGHKINDDFGPAPDPIVTTDSAGKFELPPTKGEARLLVLHEKGYIVMPHPGLPAGATLSVVPWSRVEGVARKDGKPLQAVRVRLEPANADAAFGGNIRFNLVAPTHVNGRFIFENVPSASWRASVENGADKGVEVQPEPGKTQNIELGGPAKADVG
jgi:beta-lactamase regulating signal transducer with metallopeptidase domain/uncharacterized GH25 family protein